MGDGERTFRLIEERQWWLIYRKGTKEPLGAVVQQGKVVQAAKPALDWALGKPWHELKRWAETNGGRCELRARETALPL